MAHADQMHARDRADEDGEERAGLDERVAAHELVGREMVRQDAVFDRTEERRLHTQEEQDGQLIGGVVEREADSRQRHHADFPQFHVADETRLLEFVGELTRGGREEHVGEPVLERVVRFLETQAQRIAIERLQAFDLLVIVEAIRLARALERLVEPDQPMIEKIEPVRTYLGVEDALDREDIVFGGELPLLPLERRIFGEVDPGTDLDREGAPAVGDLRQAGRGVGNEPHRTREVIVRVERIEDRVADVE